MDRTFKALYFLGMLAEIAIRLPHERRRRGQRVAVGRVSGMEQSLLGLMFLGMLFVPAIHALIPWLDRADYRLSPEAGGRAGGIGVVVLAAAVWLFWRSHADLGRNWSPSLQLREGHELVTGGVYRSIRHPTYASQWVWGVAQALLLRNWISGWSGLVLFAPLYLSRVPCEEQMMLEQFGEEYSAYMNRTGRIFPRMGGWVLLARPREARRLARGRVPPAGPGSCEPGDSGLPIRRREKRPVATSPPALWPMGKIDG